jgi:aryl-phospho-beta-D-glucosidase BglC (GH1 family)
LSVYGNKIVNSSGEVVVLRGAAIEDPYFLDVISGQFNESLFKEMAQNWKMNLIRVPVHPPLFFKKGTDYYCSNYLDKIAEWGRKYNFYIVLGWHAHGNSITGTNEFDPNPDPPWDNTNIYDPNFSSAETALRVMANRYKAENGVLYSIFDEPAYISWSDFREKVAEPLIDVIRSENADALIFVSGVNWAQDLSEVGNNPVQRNNIVYEGHIYPATPQSVTPTPSPTPEVDWEQYFGYLSNNYPLFIGEWGFVTSEVEAGVVNPPPERFQQFPFLVGDKSSYGQRLVDYAASKGIHWTAWCFSPTWMPIAIYDWNFTPTSFGKLIKDALKDK